MADTNRIAFAVCIRLPPVRHSTRYNAITVSVSRLMTQTVRSSTMSAYPLQDTGIATKLSVA
jgi:hypothetical protein